MCVCVLKREKIDSSNYISVIVVTVCFFGTFCELHGVSILFLLACRLS